MSLAPLHAPITASAVERDPRWSAVMRRDAAADGAFVFAVTTTGVYCRPSCPSRRARPENVRFFDTPMDAKAAGYRGCRRCRPEAPSIGAHETEAMAVACRAIEASEKIPTLRSLAKAAGLSPFYFHRRFKAILGVTPKAYGIAHRAKRVRDGLAVKDGSVTAAIYDAGYGSSSRFYAASDAVLGMTPGAFRTGAPDVVIRFAVGQCSLGAILVACSDKGICAILLGDDPETLARTLQDRFPKADLVGGDAAFESIVTTVIGFVEAPRLGLDLPLDLRGTAFQHRVWQALCLIPPGSTVSYATLARDIGAPRAVRAVAQACGANPIAVAVPCHRVVRTDGAVSGYRWGIERKQALIAREARP